MILVEEKPRIKLVDKVKRIYINTLVPYFEYRSKEGKTIKLNKKSVLL